MGTKEATDENSSNFITRTANNLFTAFKGGIPGIVDTLLYAWDKKVPKLPDDAWDSIILQWKNQGFIDQETESYLKTVKNQPGVFKFLLKLLLPYQMLVKNLTDTMDITALPHHYERLAKSSPNPAPLDNLVRSMIIDPGRTNENRAQMKKYGYNDTQIDNIILSYYRLYDEGVIRMCYLRGIIDESKMYERMRELGYTDTRIKEIVQTWELLPGPQDLFTMVAHEAFEPDMVKLMGLGDEFPVAQVEWLKKQGISEDWARHYWYAHWEQPSIGQGYEMLHRGVIDLDTLDMLFRTVEIPPFWRDKLTKIAYQPYTRVDVRRMHELGIVGDDELIKSYLDLGYDAEHALNMANFTIRYNLEGQAQLTRSAILESYREGLITRTDAKDLLTSQDYSGDLAEYYLTLEDYNRDKGIQQMQLDNLKDQYLLGLVTEQDTRNMLNKAGLLGSKIDALMDEWNIQIYKYQRLPSKSDLDRFFAKGIMGRAEYEETMKQQGFTFRHIQMYIQDLEGEIAQAGRAPTKADLDRWVKAKNITKEQYVSELSALGYSQKYIDLYLKDLK